MVNNTNLETQWKIIRTDTEHKLWITFCLSPNFTMRELWLNKTVGRPGSIGGILAVSEPQHDKPTKWHVRPAKTQISLGIRPGWSESSLCAQWVAKDPRFFHADSEDSDQTGRMPRLSLRWVHTHFCWFCHVAAQLFSVDQIRWVFGDN